MEKNHLNRSQRMQLKALVCLLGALFLAILLLGRLVVALLHKGESEPEYEEPEHIPVVWELCNVWIQEETEEGLLVFKDGESGSYPWADTVQSGETSGEERLREQVADITLTDGQITAVDVKDEKVSGRVLGADESGVEIEGVGKLPLAEDYRGYRLYDTLAMCTAEDICFGYSYTDFCIENGEICGVLLVKEEAMKYIRVLLKASDYAGTLHTEPIVTADTDYTVIYGSHDSRKTERHAAGEELSFGYDSSYFEGGRVQIVPDVLTGRLTVTNLNRSQGTPAYRGSLELVRTEEGIAVVNEVLLEDYLYSVVPSEMPSGYPMEALKAQAICARTYAYGHMLHAGYPEYGAHVDDSTSYQVYQNILEQQSTTAAVRETYGQILLTESGTPAGTYYYSTSCGVGSDANVWKTEAAKQITYLSAKELNRAAMERELAAEAASGQEAASESEAESVGEALRREDNFRKFISGTNPDDFEAKEGWYRWRYRVEELDTEHMLEVLQKRYAANSRLVLTWVDGAYESRDITQLGDITALSIEARGAGGVADELVIETEKERYKVISEHNIRYVLNDGTSKIERQNGSKIASPSLLPSAFFVLDTECEDGRVTGYTLTGGGFGHGVGMSQNGARSMADCGYGAEEILLYFYEACTLKQIYE